MYLTATRPTAGQVRENCFDNVETGAYQIANSMEMQYQ
jgi:16S rRNA G966 N2-methylase RsmD